MSRFSTGFGDEMVATALVLGLTVLGSFYLINYYFKGDQTAAEAPRAIQIKTLGAVDEQGNAITAPSTDQSNTAANPTPQAEPTVVPTTADITVPFGQEGVYDYPEFRLNFNVPRLEFDETNPAARKFAVDVILGNLSVTEGLVNRLQATLIKDGEVIQENVALSLSESATVNPGEKITYTASLSLIDGTDVSQITYKPGGSLTEVVHVLKPE